jgi:2-polyprenyl-3-methyl-5-hydroxy-6-metoxy-1,4-benzoquinol methylase
MAVTENPPAVDEAKLEQFMEKVVGDLGATFATLLAAFGDRLGLFKELANGPATAAEFAERARISERYSHEWLRAMAAAGYLEYDAGTDRFTLPPEQAFAFAVEGSPAFVGGVYQMIPEAVKPYERIADAFRTGSGVPQDAFGPAFWEGMERFSAISFENRLLPEWIPAMPEVQAKLEQGALVADVGCGGGKALIKLAEAFPKSKYVGYDAFEGQLARARENAKQAGVGDRVRLELLDVAKGLPEQYDLITTFDVIHDAVDPRGLMKAIREGLKPDGTYLMLEINSADDPAQNVGPIASMFYGFSIFYCMTTSLAHGGEGLGTVGLPEAKVRELSTEAGFSSVRRLPFEDPFDVVYEIKP